ncbi:MAG TPA: RNA polymerase sigma-70 factor [Puia sp.]|nr:RNA polymerase sigma-70 factor [Puia sp.]
MSKHNGTDIVEGLKKGDTQALQVIHELYYSSLCHFAEGLLGEEPASQDIVTEIFVTLWRKQNDFGTLQNIKAFLFISTRNACINYLKKQQRDNEMRTALGKYLSGDYEEFALNEMVRSEIMQQIYDAIEALPTQCKQVFKSCYVEGMKNAEIAEKFHISINTVKNHKVKALSLLRFKFAHNLAEIDS